MRSHISLRSALQAASSCSTLLRWQVFGVPWSEAVSQGWVMNAADAAKHLKLKPMDLAARFDEFKRGVDQAR